MADEKAIINTENNHGALHLGIDVGSTTVKLAVLNDENQIVYAKYQRHHTDVRACADGTVVFSDWLRGFGNLIIVDHGGTYMTVYANNESIFKNVGDRVKQGETISSVGRSGGDQDAGLYFELRYKGKPVNPSAWLSSK